MKKSIMFTEQSRAEQSRAEQSRAEQSRAEQSRAELDACGFIKTALMLIVVIYHSILFWTGSWFVSEPVFQAEPLAMIARWMNTFHIYGFVLVSGYLFFHIRFHAGRYGDYKLFLLNKAKRLLVPYAFVVVLWIIPFHCLFIDTSADTLIMKYALGVSPSQLWFLLMLFGVFAIMWPFAELVCKHEVLGAVIVLSLYLGGIVGASVFPNVFQVWTACQYCFFFWIGMKLCQHGTGALKRIPAWVWVATSIALFAMLQLMPTVHLWKIVRIALKLLLNAVGAIMVFVVLGNLSGIVNWKAHRSYSLLSRYSFQVYLFHQQLIYCSIWVLNGKVNPYMNALINCVFALVGSLCISGILMKFRATRVMIGEKP